MAFDLLLDQATNDLVFTNKDLTFTSTDPIEIGQRVAMLLRVFEGEWFLDTSYGIPYRQQIIAQARSQKEVDSIFIAAISQQAGVDSIASFTSNFDRPTRSYTAVVTINTTAGAITIPVTTKPSEQFIYPAPVAEDSQVSCDIADVIEYVNKLFYYVNYSGLPVGGTGTWINYWD